MALPPPSRKMAFEMSTQSLRKLCRERNLFSSKLDLNDVLHLQCKGIDKIEGLEEFTGLKTLYLESNAICEIENLEPTKENMRCLYLGKNMIKRTIGLSLLTELQVLDLADNTITKLEGIGCLTKLRNLNISGNKLQSVEDVQELASLNHNLETLDVANNRLSGSFAVVDFICETFGGDGHQLKWLRTVGNPFIK